MTYKIKITSTTKKPKIILVTNQDLESIEFLVKETIKRVASMNKIKITTCNLLENNGTFIRNFNHLI